jgi:hypothetical protein
VRQKDVYAASIVRAGVIVESIVRRPFETNAIINVEIAGVATVSVEVRHFDVV